MSDQSRGDARARRDVLRRAVGVAVMVGLLGAAVVVWNLPGERAGALDTSRPLAPVASPETTDSGAPAPDLGGLALPSTGPGVDEVGVSIVAVPRADQTFEVVEAVRLRGPVTQLSLAPPRFPASLGRVAGRSTTATQLRVLADGRLVPVATVVDAPLDLFTGDPADQVVLRYVLGGALVRSRTYPDPDVGRALGALRPLTTALPADLPVAIDVPGAGVRTMACPGVPGSTSCATRSRAGFALAKPLPAADAVVQLQVDLGPRR